MSAATIGTACLLAGCGAGAAAGAAEGGRADALSAGGTDRLRRRQLGAGTPVAHHSGQSAGGRNRGGAVRKDHCSGTLL